MIICRNFTIGPKRITYFGVEEEYGLLEISLLLPEITYETLGEFFGLEDAEFCSELVGLNKEISPGSIIMWDSGDAGLNTYGVNHWEKIDNDGNCYNDEEAMQEAFNKSKKIVECLWHTNRKLDRCLNEIINSPNIGSLSDYERSLLILEFSGDADIINLLS